MNLEENRFNIELILVKTKTKNNQASLKLCLNLLKVNAGSLISLTHDQLFQSSLYFLSTFTL